MTTVSIDAKIEVAEWMYRRQRRSYRVHDAVPYLGRGDSARLLARFPLLRWFSLASSTTSC